MAIRARIGVATLVAVFAACLAAVAAAQPAPSPERALRVTHSSAARTVLRPARHAAAVRRYWTPSRMRAATPLGPVEVDPRAVAGEPAAGRPSRVAAKGGFPFNRYEVTDTT